MKKYIKILFYGFCSVIAANMAIATDDGDGEGDEAPEERKNKTPEQIPIPASVYAKIQEFIKQQRVPTQGPGSLSYAMDIGCKLNEIMGDDNFFFLIRDPQTFFYYIGFKLFANNSACTYLLGDNFTQYLINILNSTTQNEDYFVKEIITKLKNLLNNHSHKIPSDISDNNFHQKDILFTSIVYQTKQEATDHLNQLKSLFPDNNIEIIELENGSFQIQLQNLPVTLFNINPDTVNKNTLLQQDIINIYLTLLNELHVHWLNHAFDNNRQISIFQSFCEHLLNLGIDYNRLDKSTQDSLKNILTNGMQNFMPIIRCNFMLPFIVQQLAVNLPIELIEVIQTANNQQEDSEDSEDSKDEQYSDNQRDNVEDSRDNDLLEEICETLKRQQAEEGGWFMERIRSVFRLFQTLPHGGRASALIGGGMLIGITAKFFDFL